MSKVPPPCFLSWVWLVTTLSMGSIALWLNWVWVKPTNQPTKQKTLVWWFELVFFWSVQSPTLPFHLASSPFSFVPLQHISAVVSCLSQRRCYHYSFSSPFSVLYHWVLSLCAACTQGNSSNTPLVMLCHPKPACLCCFIRSHCHWWCSLASCCPSPTVTSHLSYMLFVLSLLTKVASCQQHYFTVHANTWKGCLSLKDNTVPTRWTLWLWQATYLRFLLVALSSHMASPYLTLNQYASSLSDYLIKVMHTKV